MKDFYYKEYSEILGREMEHAVFGESGKVCFAFGPQGGHTYDFRNFGMIDTLAPWIEAGKLMVVCVDSIDEDTWSNQNGNPRERLELQEKWFKYVTDELYPKYTNKRKKAITTGCSMGGLHAANFFFRRPDLFNCMISLSGLFGTDHFFGDYHDELTYENCPLAFLQNIPEDHKWMEYYRKSDIIFCVGQGAWEDEMLSDARALDAVLTERGIDHWADFWGYDVNHDWPWWQVQLPYFMEHILGNPEEEAKAEAEKKPAAKKTTAKKVATKKTETKKAETKKADTKKTAAKKTETKDAAKKSETKAVAEKAAEPKKETKAAAKKSETKAVAEKTAEPKKETKTAAKKTAATKEASAEKASAKKTAAKKTAAKK